MAPASRSPSSAAPGPCYANGNADMYSVADRCRLAAALRAKAVADGDSTLATHAEISRLETARLADGGEATSRQRPFFFAAGNWLG